LAVLLGGKVSALLLLLPEEGAHPGKGVRGHNKASCDEGFAASDVAVTTALLVLGGVGVEEVVLAVADQAEGRVGVVHHGTLDLLGVLLNDGKLLVDCAQDVGADRVGFGDVGLDVAVRTLGVGDKGREEFLVAGLGEVKGLLAVWVLLEVGDAVGDSGV